MNEILISRHEFKYVLDYSSYFSLCSKLSKLLKKDSHGEILIEKRLDLGYMIQKIKKLNWK